MDKCKKCGHEKSDHQGEYDEEKLECLVNGCDCKKYIDEDEDDDDDGNSGLGLLGGILGESIVDNIFGGSSEAGSSFGGFGGGQSGGGGSNGSW